MQFLAACLSLDLSSWFQPLLRCNPSLVLRSRLTGKLGRWEEGATISCELIYLLWISIQFILQWKIKVTSTYWRSAEWKEPEGNQQITVVQVKFHISGPYNRGVVYVEKNVSSGEYRTLIFQTDDRRERFSVLQPAEPKSSLFSLA